MRILSSRIASVVVISAMVAAAGCSTAPKPPSPAAVFLVGTQTVSGTTNRSGDVSVRFSLPMRPQTVSMTLNDVPLALDRIHWNVDHTVVTVDARVNPYTKATLQVSGGATATNGQKVGRAAVLRIAPLPLEAVNTESDIRSVTSLTPVAIVIDNAPPTRPQSGIEHADIVFEYISEYQISRFTALFFGKAPAVVGPIRSCRMINMYIVWSFRAVQMCSGVSAGTRKWVLGRHAGVPKTRIMFEDFTHFFRDHSRVPPYNLYTTGSDIASARRQHKEAAPLYLLDPPHPDIIAGALAQPPTIPKQAVSYSYDAATKTYLRSQDGRPFIVDGHSIHVKNVVVMNLPSHDAGWIEDENGGAHSVWYDMLGSGPVTIWSDGHMIKGTWHIGPQGLAPVKYWLNDQAPWFTDANGNVIELNSGLTWIHAVGTWP